MDSLLDNTFSNIIFLEDQDISRPCSLLVMLFRNIVLFFEFSDGFVQQLFNIAFSEIFRTGK